MYSGLVILARILTSDSENVKDLRDTLGTGTFPGLLDFFAVQWFIENLRILCDE